MSSQTLRRVIGSIGSIGSVGTVGCAALIMVLSAGPAAGQTPIASESSIRPLTEFSPAFLGMYRKVMEIEGEIERYATQHGVDVDLARAIAIQESGGNADLNSAPGANGYFQLMPATFRSLKVQTNIEAGLKYLSQMIKRFGREDYAVAAYNGGPGRVSRGRPPLETLQYMLSVESYRMVLKLHHVSIRHHATALRLDPVQLGDDWWTISRRVGIPIVQLRFHNPFLATRPLHVGQIIAYPPAPRTDLLSTDGDDLTYRIRFGDHYLHLAFMLGVTRTAMREANGLWHLGSTPPGLALRVPLAWTGRYDEHRVSAGDTLPAIAKRYRSNVWRIIRDNGIWDEQLPLGQVIRVRPEPTKPAAPKPQFVTYRVTRGDTLGAIARRHRTSVRAIQNANSMGRRTMIRPGQRLRVPAR